MTLQCDPPAAPAGKLIVRSAHPLNAETPQELLDSPVTPADLFFVRSHGDIPTVDPERYRLTVHGGTGAPVDLHLDDLRDRFEPVSVDATLACAGNRRSEIQPPPVGLPWKAGAIGTARWTGARLGDVLRAAGLDPTAEHVAFAGLDSCVESGGCEFGASVPISKALGPEVLLAYEMNGAPLTPRHGYPVRVVVPGYIGARSVKWLRSVRAQHEPSESFYQREDYTIDGVQLSDLPLTSAVTNVEVEGGTVRVEGYAVGGGGQAVERVEVSWDGGRTWVPADVDGAPQQWTWRLWRATTTLPPGPTDVVVRAWDGSGACQPEHTSAGANPRGYMHAARPRVRVLVPPASG